MNTTIKYNQIVKIVFFSAVLGFVYNFISDTGIKIIRDRTKLAAVNDSTLFSKPVNENGDQFNSITTKQAYKLFALGKVIFIDARDKWDFADAHIPGSINIPEYDFEPTDSVTNSINKNLRYVVYCGGDDCDVSIRLARKLKKSNFTNLLIFKGGWQAWTENGYPTEKGNTNK